MQLTNIITPSPDWLSCCRAHLGIHNHSSSSSDEEVFAQILFSDLRDVVAADNDADDVQTTSADNNGNSETNDMNDIQTSDNGVSNHKTLHRAIAQSQQQSKSTLTIQGGLMVQMEEILDVSKNSTDAINAAGDENAAPRNGRANGYNNYGSNYKNATYKLLLSTGHLNSTFTALITTSLPPISSTSPPGIKLLLFSTLTIRHGIVFLEKKNTLVLGGQVQTMMMVQREKMEIKRRMEGVGVDATVRALIGVQDESGLEEVDEGEGESRDVLTPPNQPQQQSQVAAPPNNNGNIRSYTVNPTGDYNQSANSQQQTGNAVGRNPYQPNSGGSTNNRNLYQPTDNAILNGTSTNVSSYQPSNNTANTNPYQQTNTNNRNAYQQSGNGAKTNPYQTGSAVSRNPYQSTTCRSNPYERNNTPNTSNNPYMRSNASASSQNSQDNVLSSSEYETSNLKTNQLTGPSSTASYGPINTSTQTSNIQSQPRQPTPKTVNPYSNNIAPNPPTVTPATTKRGTVSSQVTMNTTTPPNNGTESFSFSELKAHLLRLSQNRALYEENWGKIFIVPCKLRSGADSKPVFNIHKVKQGKKGGKKHEFLFISHFLGPKSSDGQIACRVESSLMEPYFNGYTPTDIRKLQKEEKERATKVVNESSTQFLHEFSTLAEVHVRLMLGPEEFFGKVSNVGSSSSDWMEKLSDPVLVVVDRKTV